MSQPVLDAGKEVLYRRIVIAVSIVVPCLVAFLILMPQTGKLGDFDVSLFPSINAALNSLTGVSLIMALIAIRSKNIPVHKAWMTLAFALSACFLVLYVLYHFQGPPTKYGDTDHNGVVDASEIAAAGFLRTFYLILLAAHIILAAVGLPFILLSFYFSLSNQIDKHKKLVKFTWPVWTFVAFSGVLVYFLIRPFYPF
jgi:putative membrane protein